MRLQKASTLGLLGSFAIGAGVTLGMMNNYTTQSPTPSTSVNMVGDQSTDLDSPLPTPTESISAPATAEGDDGSLGGPVFNSENQTTPTYVYISPSPTSEDADDDTATPALTPAAPVTHTGTSQVTETPSAPPTVTKTPSPDDHSETPSP